MNITDNVKRTKFGSPMHVTLTNLFTKITNGSEITEDDLAKLNIVDIQTDPRFEVMSKNKQQQIQSKLKEINPDIFTKNTKKKESNAYFVCMMCSYTEEMTNGVVLFDQKYDMSTNDSIDDFSMCIYDQTLPRTRHYLCHNKKCPTYKNPKLETKEAVITKSKAGQVVYVCTLCMSAEFGSQ
jgi:hypothetical protein